MGLFSFSTFPKISIMPRLRIGYDAIHKRPSDPFAASISLSPFAILVL
jgi:hypothetical protein